MASIWPFRTAIMALVAPSKIGDPDVGPGEPPGVGVAGRHPQDADLPGAAAGAGQLEVGPGADRAVAAGHELELVDVVGAGRQVVAGPGRGQLVAVDDDVDLAPGEDLEQVFPLDLAEDRLGAELAADPVHQVGLEADPAVVVVAVEVGGPAFLVGAEGEAARGPDAVEGVGGRGAGGSPPARTRASEERSAAGGRGSRVVEAGEVESSSGAGPRTRGVGRFAHQDPSFLARGAGRRWGSPGRGGSGEGRARADRSVASPGLDHLDPKGSCTGDG